MIIIIYRFVWSNPVSEELFAAVVRSEQRSEIEWKFFPWKAEEN